MKLINLEKELNKLQIQIIVALIFSGLYFIFVKEYFHELSLFVFFVLSLLLGSFTLHLFRLIICIIIFVRRK